VPSGIHDGDRRNKRTPEQRKLDRILMVRLLRRGYSKSSIAQKLGVCRTQIEYDWKKVLQQLAKDYDSNPEHLLAKQLAELEELKLEARKAFEWYKGVASKEAAKHLFDMLQAAQESGMKLDLPPELVIKLKSKEPNPALLQVIEKCLKAERDLAGLEAPKRAKLQVSHGISYDEIANRLPQNGEAIPDQSASKLAALEQKAAEASSSPQPFPSEPTNGSGNGAGRNGHGESKVDL
jgi:transposase-like protein